LPDHRDVIFRVARYDAGFATRAAAQVDRHATGISFVLIWLIERKTLRGFFLSVLGKLRILAKVIERGNANQASSEGILALFFDLLIIVLNGMMNLRRRHEIVLARLFNLKAFRDLQP